MKTRDRAGKIILNALFIHRSCAVILLLFLFCGISYAAPGDGSFEIPRAESALFSAAGVNEDAWKDADVLTDFIVPINLDVATQRSEARVLHDDNNLYVYIKAYEGFGGPVKLPGEDNPWPEDNFEIFIRSHPESDVYYQIAVSASGALYSAEGRNPAWGDGVASRVFADQNFWSVVLTVPLGDLRLTPPGEGQERRINLNICRNDKSVPVPPEGVLYDSAFEPSSFAILDAWDYHQPDTWAEGVLRRSRKTSPRTVRNRSSHVSLTVNPSFSLEHDGRTVGWTVSPAADRVETMPLSGEWVIRARGDVYHFLGQSVHLNPGEVYTFRIRARMFGDDAQSLGIIQFIRGPDRSVREGVYPAWQVPLTREFHEYYLPFVAPENSLHFRVYRIGERTQSSGIDIESVRLYEGEVSAFEIRRLSRVGGKRVEEGTEPLIPENIYGRRGEKMSVLAIVSQVQSSREVYDIFSGLDVDFEIITTSSREPSDVYYTDYDPDLIKEKIDDGSYDLYMIGSRAAGGVGPELAEAISENVKKGAGLFINSIASAGEFRELINTYRPTPVDQSHYLRSGFPSELIPLRGWWRDPGRVLDPSERIKEARLRGEDFRPLPGRIVLAETTGDTPVEFKVLLEQEAYGHVLFPYRKYSDAYIARIAYYAAGKANTRIAGIKRDADYFLAEIEGAGSGSSLRWSLEDKTGRMVSEGREGVAGNVARIGVPRMTLSGYHVLAVWLEDGSGNVLDYCAKVVRHEGPGIEEFVSAKDYYRGSGPGEFILRLRGARRGMTVEWRLEDFASRVLSSGSERASERVRLRVALDPVYTNLARLRVLLKEGDEILDEQRHPVYLPDRDRDRVWNDFNVNIWPAGSGSHPDSAPFIARQLESIGVRSYLLPAHGIPLVLNEGMAAGGEYRGTGDWFCALRLYGDNIRRPSLAEQAVLERLRERTRRIAESERRYGVVNTAVCDEPNDARPSSADELDAHPENLTEYRRRMREKYGTIKAFNDRCSTDYGSFEEIGLVLTDDIRQRENFAEFLEWRNYNVDRWVEAIAIIGEISREIDDAPVSLYNSFGHRALSTNDYWKLLTRANLDFSHEYTSMVYMGSNPLTDFCEFYRSFRPDMRVWGFVGYSWSQNHANFQPWWFALHRYGGLTWYAALSGTRGGGRWLNLIDIPNFGLTRDAKMLKDSLRDSRLLEGMGKLFLEYEWEDRDIAVLYSQPSLLTAWCRGTEVGRNELTPGSPYYNYHYSRHRVRYLLEELLYQYDFISHEQLREGILGSYRVLILPHIEALSSDDVAKIKEFAGNGGVVVSDIQPGGYDELGTPRGDFPLSGLSSGGSMEVFGGNFDDRDAGQRTRMLGILREAGARPALMSDGVPVLRGREAMHFRRGEMNVYAVTRNFARSDDSESQTLIFPRGGHLYDLRAGEYLGEGDKVHVEIPNAGTVVYGAYPYRVSAVEISAPSSVRGGDDLRAVISVKTDGRAKAGHHVFRAEVVSPDGESRWFMGRNLPAPGGTADFVLRMAENDPSGEWKLRVRDVMTGAEAEKTFTLAGKQ